jgi:hypothetical protein
MRQTKLIRSAPGIPDRKIASFSTSKRGFLAIQQPVSSRLAKSAQSIKPFLTDDQKAE